MFYAVWFNMLKSDEYTETHLVPIVLQYGWVCFKESYMKRSLDSDLEKRSWHFITRIASAVQCHFLLSGQYDCNVLRFSIVSKIALWRCYLNFFVFLLVRSCLLITLIRCLNSTGLLCSVVKCLIVSGRCARRTKEGTDIVIYWAVQGLCLES